MIHPTAIIDASARIGENVSIGAYSVISADVEIGPNCKIGPHVVIDGPTRLGANNTIYQFASVGGDPQDKKFHGERVTLEIGDGNMIREFVTINRGTGDGGGVTRIGDNNWIMAYVHIAHDCIIGNNTIMANCASLAGHCRVDDWAILGGFSLIHQFCQIGAHAFTSMGSSINRDVPPYVTVAGTFAEPKGINSEGLRRRGFASDKVMAIKRAFKTLYHSGLPLAEARAQIAEQSSDIDELKLLVEFIDRSERSLLR
ncbi:acyl-[acyl-carrier-protein]--UDP-N-acetylglucosamine O-acyltransferase [Ahniella affigens]|uniref:Acyl-[acyl-carrier-protein]--UDP-N-acetylglucosamine O-acyltransferase n=1 Tax=Ahniella affigens TaxID=2021234 RepID=A0A2P1PMI9_9GAMM|nr:acyl-ACP--UDP-N-acetylglucosamine O-acyltransferase [Ahniella affigens]AVP96056.1 acyl-[acyl-carrier-protein]--UDP-N-acetylglucosamine O-acyltransferase [Ahniella affigens]